MLSLALSLHVCICLKFKRGLSAYPRDGLLFNKIIKKYSLIVYVLPT